MLKINNLHAEVEGKEVLKGVDLKLDKGKIYALMGPNGSGKSTLANVLAGNPIYKVSNGEILFNNKNLLEMKPNQRAKEGIFLSFQHPLEIQGVSIANLLRQSYNSLNTKIISLLEFRKLISKKSEDLKLKGDFIERSVNCGFSGGEKKKSEILQMLVLSPELAILDEIDSGLDIDSLKIISKAINEFKKQGKTILIITHYKRILEYVNPDKVFVIIDGKIEKEGDFSIVDELEGKGYDWLKAKKI